MKKILYGFLLLLATTSLAAPQDYYIAQTATGSGSGADASNCKDYTFFNTAGNWSGTPGTSGKICPGDTVHLVGTFTSSLDFQGGGKAGNVLTVYFEPGAKFSNTHWTSGYVFRTVSSALYAQGDYITIDGGVNGLIESTDVGTSKTYLTGAAGVYSKNASHITVKNLTIRDMFVREVGPSTVISGSGVTAESANNTFTDLTVDNCIISNCGIGIIADWGLGSAGYTFTNNNIQYVNWGIGCGGRSTGATLDGLTVSGNTIGNYANWDGTDIPSWDALHHNGVFLYAQDTASTGWVHNIRVFSNHFLDGYGGHSTSGIYMNGNDMDADIEIYNNLFDAYTGGPTNGLVTLAIAKGTARIYNNTFTGTSGGYANAIAVSGQFGTTKYKTYYITNNVSMNCLLTYAISMTAYTTLDQDYNIAGGTPANGFYSYSTGGSLAALSFASWQAAGRDVHGLNTDPLLNFDGTLTASSPAIDAGTSLSSYFTVDKNGVSRPQGSAWDMGAYEYVFVGSPTSALLGKSTLKGKATIK